MDEENEFPSSNFQKATQLIRDKPRFWSHRLDEVKGS